MQADDVMMPDAPQYELETDIPDHFLEAAVHGLSLDWVHGENESRAPPARIKINFDRAIDDLDMLNSHDISEFCHRSVDVSPPCTLYELQTAILGDLNKSNIDMHFRPDKYVINYRKCEKFSTSRATGCFCHSSSTNWRPLHNHKTPANATLEEMGLLPGHYHVQVCERKEERR